jgi:hypothetical protein
MKKLNIIAIAISLVAGAACASDKTGFRDIKLQRYKDLLVRFDKECQVPMFRWMSGSHQIQGCRNLAGELYSADYDLDKNYHIKQGTFNGPAYEYWK